MRSFIEQDVLKTIPQYYSDLSDQSALEIRVRICFRRLANATSRPKQSYVFEYRAKSYTLELHIFTSIKMSSAI